MRVTISFLPILVLLLSGSAIGQDSDVEQITDSDDEITVEDVREETDDGKDNFEIPYKTPTPIGNAYLAEHFDDRADYEKRWIVSETKKEGIEENIAKFDGKWELEPPEKNPLKGDLGLVLKSKAHHHAISTRLDRPFSFDNKPFVLQYEVRFQNGQECGGAYLKLISQTPNLDLRNFNDKSPYSIMFGPDKCGNDNKLHFIFRHRNPKNGSFTEKHWKKTNIVPKFDDVFKDKKPHLFTLIMTPDNRYEVLLDKKSLGKGSLFEDFNPPVNPPAEIDDPKDKKPETWDEREKIPDPSASKPEDWDEDAPRQIPDPNARKPDGWLEEEPELIPDPHADKPKDWDDEMDGEWEAPLINNHKCEKVGCGEWKPNMIDNPKYRGKWKAPLIENPDFKGKWKPRRIINPDFFEDKHPFRLNAIGAVGFELWSMSENILFDNIIITDDLLVADQWAAETWALKKELADRETDNYLVQLIKYTNKYPWLWAVYVVVIGLPVVLFISFCCVSSPSQEKTDDAAKRKKTDAYFPDDPILESQSKSSTQSSPSAFNDTLSSDSGSSGGLKEKNPNASKVSFSDLAKEQRVEEDAEKDEEEVEEEVEDDEEQAETEEEEDEEEIEDKQEVVEEDKDEDEVEKDIDSGEPKRSSPRQRPRARRE